MNSSEPSALSRSSGNVVALPFEGSDEALVRAIVQGHPGAPAMLYDRHAARVRCVLARVLGVDRDLPDLLHEVFAQALTNMHQLEQPDRLAAWLTTIAMFTARGHIRRRKRQRWLTFFAPETIAEHAAPDPDDDARLAMRHTYSVLEKLPTDERMVFALRFLDGMELTEVAEACAISLATTKRRLTKARARFDALARRDPVLRDWVEP